jgi:hypothetical protein
MYVSAVENVYVVEVSAIDVSRTNEPARSVSTIRRYVTVAVSAEVSQRKVIVTELVSAPAEGLTSENDPGAALAVVRPDVATSIVIRRQKNRTGRITALFQ